MKKTVKSGEIALIPIGEETYIPGKVLYLSKRYKNVILLALFDNPVKGKKMPENFPEEPFEFLYTSQVAIKNGRWKSVGIQSLNIQEQDKAIRIIGGSVWEGDQEIRLATEEDYKKLPKMQVLGAALVEKKAKHFVSLKRKLK